MTELGDKRGSVARRMGHLYVQGLLDVEQGRPSIPPYSVTPAEAQVYALGRMHATPIGEMLPAHPAVTHRPAFTVIENGEDLRG